MAAAVIVSSPPCSTIFSPKLITLGVDEAFATGGVAPDPPVVFGTDGVAPVTISLHCFDSARYVALIASTSAELDP